jgi:hypothetical protein
MTWGGSLTESEPLPPTVAGVIADIGGPRAIALCAMATSGWAAAHQPVRGLYCKARFK